jgi:hypothetical protein
MEMLENLDEMYMKGDKEVKLSIIKLAYNNKVSYDPITKRLNLVYSDLVQEIVNKNTPTGALVRRQGIEPRLTEPKPVVLPLDDLRISSD